jgi:hypothetical protein
MRCVPGEWAADQGDAEAQWSMGAFCSEGTGGIVLQWGDALYVMYARVEPLLLPTVRLAIYVTQNGRFCTLLWTIRVISQLKRRYGAGY